MSISGKMYVWGKRAKNVPQESGVYALFNEARVLIYIGAANNLQERFTHYLKSNFSKDPRKRETKYYKRETTHKQEDRMKSLLNEYRRKHNKLPECNLPPNPPEEDTSKWGFYFYEDIGKPLSIAAFSHEDFSERIKKVPAASLEFHQQRGDFARWFRNVFKDFKLAESLEKIDETGEDLRVELLNLVGGSEKATCPECGIENHPVKTWKMAGKPSKTGIRLQLTIGHYKCLKCKKSFRRVITKNKIQAS